MAGQGARSAVRPALAVALHELRSFVANPSVAVTAAMVVAFSWVFAGPFGFYPSFALSFMGFAGVGSLGGIATTGILVDERSRGALGTLRRSGVPLAAVVAGKVAAGVLAADALTFACALAAGFDVPAALLAALSMLLAAVPVILASAVVGLRGSDYQNASLPATVMTLFCMGVGAARTFGLPIWPLPTGAAEELLAVLAFGATPCVPVVLSVAAGLAWSAAAGWLLVREVRRAG